MPDIHAAVIAELKRRKWSNYKLHQQLKGKRTRGEDVPYTTLVQFLRGENTINSADLGLIFDVFGWPVPPK